MKKFLVLYQSTTSAKELMDQSTPEEMQAGMAEWEKWRAKTEASGGGFEYGMPLQAGKHLDSKGNISESKSEATGYSLLEAETLDDAMELLKDHPHLQRAEATIEVLELLPMPGM